ncbi:DUF3078 domain-containing protein [Flavobacterium capsici]|uniref:DUF3078 domain-containing protein n=1 Tax=Flavobacterium capsici TaxID=3075618 RepID=A0AA96EWD1_9FLAO|nr:MULTISPECIES: DUF3078 domain-containing protein [unclassified Flavobacterium]WNM19416.1 DUF3078 domain-containing protein [Flavobacterium sp. PMR2A8]WNM20805.1 DUF3078 domain-containing protein [Flavobacterium sp. PMTSA4]
MKFFKSSLFLLILIISSTTFSQEQTIPKKDSISFWKQKNTVGLDISQIAFVNWNAGGVSSISGLLKGDFIRKYNKNNLKWVNELIIRYGVNKQDGIELRKTDDAIKFNSTLGYRKDTLTHWYTTAKFNFSTQFTNGYAYPNTTNAISKPFAPAYFFLGTGSEYNNKAEKFSVYISPLTMKTTLVLDQKLANQGAFGVKKATYDVDGNLLTEGELYRMELGFLVTSQYKKEVFKNIIWENRVSLYSDYINKFGNIDVDWQFKFDLVVNEYVKANIGAHIIYDDDIKATEELNGEQITIGPKIQLKQMLGVGLVYDF